MFSAELTASICGANGGGDVLQMRVVFVVAASVVCAAIMFAVFAAPALAQEPLCKEQEKTTQPSSESAQGLIELQPNAARPTFDIALNDDTAGGDEISFLPQAGKRVGRDADIAVEVTDSPRAGSQPLSGGLFVAAHGTSSGRRAVVELCLEHLRSFDAGRYEGSISVYGPKFADFNYALVITKKWPGWTALVVIFFVVVVFSAIALASDVPSVSKETWHDLKAVLALAIGLLVGIALAALTYWTIYTKNATWGDDPGTQLTALAIASFTAATGGLTAAHRLLPPADEGDSDGDLKNHHRTKRHRP